MVVVTAALLFGSTGPALASDALPEADSALVQVFVDSAADVDRLNEQYDLAEYKQIEDDGSIMLSIDTTAAERAELRSGGLPHRSHDRGRLDARGRGRGARCPARTGHACLGVRQNRRAQAQVGGRDAG